MSLFAATLVTGIALLVLGAALLWNGSVVARAAQAFPRSKMAAVVFFGGAAAWFLRHIWHLGAADFGEYRNLLLLLFSVVAVAAFFVARDFLAVRGVAILVLLSARELLDAAFLQPPLSRLFLVSFVYVTIVLALYFGALPYQARDFFAWLFQKPARPRALGAACAAYGLLLTVAAATY